ncbi:hypothetical protein LshimejAT787_0300640 [Lyophyllum shimeji]|uniref:Protein kinase domain-containing protein n=1 Tax=Lyophyllum shimeji TaxID=47721 RepID=A0A9P3PHX0_LYOSH|nr:hypothetical protein LshimejAT787_0300640 [Lyophyllum shimeji]
MKHIIKGVHLAHLGPRGAQATEVVIAKIARGTDSTQMRALKNEAEFYARLRDLQGRFLPRCYGFFRCKDQGEDIACLLLEYCIGFAPSTEQEIVEYHRAKMIAVCKIHEYGVQHGNLSRAHHFVRTGDGVRVLDFSLAVLHSCVNAYPVNTNPRAPRDLILQCKELVNMEMTCGFRHDRAAEQGYYRKRY